MRKHGWTWRQKKGRIKEGKKGVGTNMSQLGLKSQKHIYFVQTALQPWKNGSWSLNLSWKCKTLEVISTWPVLNILVHTSEMQVRMMKHSLALLYRIVSEKKTWNTMWRCCTVSYLKKQSSKCRRDCHSLNSVKTKCKFTYTVNHRNSVPSNAKRMHGLV